MENNEQKIDKYRKELVLAVKEIREIALKYPELYDIVQICKDIK